MKSPSRKKRKYRKTAKEKKSNKLNRHRHRLKYTRKKSRARRGARGGGDAIPKLHRAIMNKNDKANILRILEDNPGQAGVKYGGILPLELTFAHTTIGAHGEYTEADALEIILHILKKYPGAVYERSNTVGCHGEGGCRLGLLLDTTFPKMEGLHEGIEEATGDNITKIIEAGHSNIL